MRAMTLESGPPVPAYDVQTGDTATFDLEHDKLGTYRIGGELWVDDFGFWRVGEEQVGRGLVWTRSASFVSARRGLRLPKLEGAQRIDDVAELRHGDLAVLWTRSPDKWAGSPHLRSFWGIARRWHDGTVRVGDWIISDTPALGFRARSSTR